MNLACKWSKVVSIRNMLWCNRLLIIFGECPWQYHRSPTGDTPDTRRTRAGDNFRPHATLLGGETRESPSIHGGFQFRPDLLTDCQDSLRHNYSRRHPTVLFLDNIASLRSFTPAWAPWSQGFRRCYGTRDGVAGATNPAPSPGPASSCMARYVGHQPNPCHPCPRSRCQPGSSAQ